MLTYIADETRQLYSALPRGSTRTDLPAMSQTPWWTKSGEQAVMPISDAQVPVSDINYPSVTVLLVTTSVMPELPVNHSVHGCSVELLGAILDRSSSTESGLRRHEQVQVLQARPRDMEHGAAVVVLHIDGLDLGSVVTALEREVHAAHAKRRSRSVNDQSGSQPLIEPFRERELEILHLLAAGRSNQEMADHLIISVGTVRWHLKNIYGKLGVHSRTQAILRARALGVLNEAAIHALALDPSLGVE